MNAKEKYTISYRRYRLIYTKLASYTYPASIIHTKIFIDYAPKDDVELKALKSFMSSFLRNSYSIPFVIKITAAIYDELTIIHGFSSKRSFDLLDNTQIFVKQSTITKVKS